MLPNDEGTCNWLAEELAAARIVEREQLDPHLADFTAECPYADADAFATHLARVGLLSKYQARRALDGDAKKLVLGAYLIVEVIGNGSLGPVYKAIGRADQKSYAVKVLPRRSWSIRLARSQVRSFGELAGHDGVVPFIDVGAAHGLHYLVWPFTEGRTLEKIVQEFGPLSSAEIARIGVRIAETLRVCLTRGLIHGLIKPCNVLVAQDGQTRLLDFGIGALLAENAEDEPIVDTVSRAESLAAILECAAPECVADSSKWTPAGDQYSLGCTLYFTATGRYPFPGGSFVEKIVSHQTRAPAPVRSLNPDIAPGIADVIERLMQKIPADRYPKMEALIGDLAPLATVSRLYEPTPVNVQTPMPKSRLSVPPSSDGSLKEPAVVELPPVEPKRSLVGRLFGSGEGTGDILHATVVTEGTFEPGETIVLHVYTHGSADTERLIDAAREHRDSMRIIGSGRTKRPIAYGSRIGLHLAIAGTSIDETMPEFDCSPSANLHRFTVKIPPNSPRKPRTGRLMIGHDGRLIAQIDFVLPVGAT